MSNILTDSEIEKLKTLGEKIQLSLSCDCNGTGVPCRTDRLGAVDFMIEYLKIHGYEVVLN
jgi:hypothetical protein